jgi:hypothetical protein
MKVGENVYFVFTMSYFDYVENEAKSVLVPIEDDVKQSRTDSTPPVQVLKSIITSSRSQQTTPLEMSIIDDHNNNTTLNGNETNHLQHQRSISEQRQSINSSIKRSSSDDHTSTLVVDDEEELRHEIKSIATTTNNRTIQMPKLKYTNKPPSSSTSMVTKNGKSSVLKWNSLLNTRKYRKILSLRIRRYGNSILFLLSNHSSNTCCCPIDQSSYHSRCFSSIFS